MFENIDIKDLKAVGDAVKGRYHDWSGYFQSNYYKKWEKNLRSFFAYTPEVDRFRSKIHIPMVRKEIDTAVPRHMEVLFATDPPFHAVPDRGHPEWEAKAEVIENLIGRYMKQCGFREAVMLALQDSMIYGYGPLKMRWLFRQNLEGKPIVDMPVFEPVNVFQTYFDPCVPLYAGIPSVIHAEYVRRSTILKWESLGAEFEKEGLEDLAGTVPDRYALDVVHHAKGLHGPHGYFSGGGVAQGTEDDPWILVLEASCEDYIVTIDGTTGNVLKVIPNVMGHVPFCFARYKPQSQMIIGQAMPELIGDLNDLANTMARALQDNILSSAHGMYVVDKGAGITAEDLIPMPNKAIFVETSNNRSAHDMIRPLRQESNFNVVSGTQSYLDGLVEGVTGQSALTLGSTTPRAETMGTTVSMIEQANKRQQAENQRWGEEVIGRAAMLIYVAMQRYWDNGLVRMKAKGRRVPKELIEHNFFVESYDQDGVPQIVVGPDEMNDLNDDDFTFVPTGSAGLAARELQQQESAKLQQYAIQDPLLGAEPKPGLGPARVELHKTLFGNMILQSEIGGKDKLIRTVNAAYDEYLQPPPPPPMQPPPQGAMPGGPPQGGQPQGPPPPSPQPPQSPMEMSPDAGMMGAPA